MVLWSNLFGVVFHFLNSSHSEVVIIFPISDQIIRDQHLHILGSWAILVII